MPGVLRRLAIVLGLALVAIAAPSGPLVDGRRWEAARPIVASADGRISSMQPSGRRWS